MLAIARSPAHDDGYPHVQRAVLGRRTALVFVRRSPRNESSASRPRANERAKGAPCRASASRSGSLARLCPAKSSTFRGCGTTRWMSDARRSMPRVVVSKICVSSPLSGRWTTESSVGLRRPVIMREPGFPGGNESGAPRRAPPWRIPAGPRRRPSAHPQWRSRSTRSPWTRGHGQSTAVARTRHARSSIRRPGSNGLPSRRTCSAR